MVGWVEGLAACFPNHFRRGLPSSALPCNAHACGDALQRAVHTRADASSPPPPSSPCSLVERQHAWVEDPAPPEAGGMPGGGGGGGGDDGELEEPPVLTLAALQREYAVVRGHAVLAAAMPGAPAHSLLNSVLPRGLSSRGGSDMHAAGGWCSGGRPGAMSGL